jgi:hypothetical protein
MSEPRFKWTTVKVITGTTSGTVGTQTAHAHGLGATPFTYNIRMKSNGVVYESAVPDATNIYVKGSVASLAFEAALLI